MILDDPKNRPWVVVVSALAVSAIAWYSVECGRAGRLLGGGSRPGLTFGIAGGLICLSEMLIWPRKALRRWGQTLRLGGVQHWMRAHVWLGLLSLPLLVMHGGVYPWGGSLSTLLMVLFLAVIASGIWGLAMQQYLPRRLLRDVPGETIYSQIGLVRAQLRDEAAQLVRAACGTRVPEAFAATTPPFRIAGKTRPESAVVEVDPLADPSPLVDDFADVIAPFLCPEPVYAYFLAPSGRPPRPDRSGRSPLSDPGRARFVFDDLRSRLDPGASPVVDALERLCEQGRQLDRQARLHVWLHNWLAVHLPLSVAMIVLMIFHAVAALDYL